MAEAPKELIDRHKEVCNAHEALAAHMESEAHSKEDTRIQALNATRLTQLQQHRDQLAALIDKHITGDKGPLAQ